MELSKQLCQENDDKLRRMEEGIVQSQESQKMFLDDLELSGKPNDFYNSSQNSNPRKKYAWGKKCPRIRKNLNSENPKLERRVLFLNGG